MEFHPEIPNVLVAGLFTGEIRLWLIDGEEPLIAWYGHLPFPSQLLSIVISFMLLLGESSSIDDYFHREPITQVCWVKSISTEAINRNNNNSNNNNSFMIASVSGDGRVLFWDVPSSVLTSIQNSSSPSQSNSLSTSISVLPTPKMTTSSTKTANSINLSASASASSYASTSASASNSGPTVVPATQNVLSYPLFGFCVVPTRSYHGWSQKDTRTKNGVSAISKRNS